MKLRAYIIITVLSLILALIFRFFILTTYRIPTGSMQPTLKPGDFIVASPLSYGFPKIVSSGLWPWSEPQRGDVVVFSYPQQAEVSYVKRIIAIPGDKVEIKNEILLINDLPATYKIEENQSDSPGPDNFRIVSETWQNAHRRLVLSEGIKNSSFGPIQLGPDDYFLLGDNRDTSDDSRNWGAVPKSLIKSKVLQVWLSLDWQSKWAQNRFPRVRWERMFSRVH